jgi:hypothetical protein
VFGCEDLGAAVGVEVGDSEPAAAVGQDSSAMTRRSPICPITSTLRSNARISATPSSSRSASAGVAVASTGRSIFHLVSPLTVSST